MAEVDELNRQIQIREMRREKLEVNLNIILYSSSLSSASQSSSW